jgi:proline dehydrogenase
MKSLTSSLRRPLFLRNPIRSPYWVNLRPNSSTTSPTSSAPQALPRSDTFLSGRLPPLSMMPGRLLLQSYFITSILASPGILKLCLPLMNKIANSQSTILNPDRNPLLHVLVRKLIYDHFAAGETVQEVKKSIAKMKQMGFKGVILGYTKEVNVSGGTTVSKGTSDAAILDWKEGTLKTLACVGQGDFLAVK